MRTTLTLDDDIASKLKSVTRRTGQPFKVVVNEALRRGLAASRPSQTYSRFRVEARDLGGATPGLSLDNIGALLEQVEGPLHR
jgi:hypothetical protein